MALCTTRSFTASWRRALPVAGLAAVVLLSACSSSSKKPQPAELPPVAALMGTQLAWSTQVGESHASLAPLFVAGRVFVAGNAGTVAAIDAATGKDVWRLNLNTPIAAGVGSDGQTAAVVTRNNQLVAISDGGEVWRVRLPARSFTAPLVAGGRVFVLTADRVVTAFDGKTGARLWNQSRPAEPLVLSQTGALLAVGDTLVAGLAGRLTGLNPDNGAVRWEAPIATSRGTNEVERLVDIMGPVSRIGNSICARAYSAAVGCVDASRGTVTWTRAAQGTTGVHGDDRLVFGSESDGRFQAWQRSNGEPAWGIDRLKYRGLTAPLALGRVVAVADSRGLVHLISREDGSEMTRLNTDGSPILAAPVLAGDALVVQTRNGGVFAWRPQ
ncbi:outer membrane protein assembly factor BamB [Hydrogenophaga laconesensis]|uniref:Outer membrane protein assembly factor BamB n=1 Tax=Hydrogenophaga laconesensis TaxID=1805971 RepID=A0ABU1V542_9BURK|nr:outer membrane protein assembly factor BamB [Hydrogenophaga laconesensis]MDR7092453.1 outer membrane assembly lipoprotein YfgL [Hydrogenophaga laconesensis]